jgi:hypothetical protein
VSRGGAVPDLATFLGATLGAGTAAMGAGPLASSALDTFLSARGGAQSPGSADPSGTFRDAAGILRDQNFNIVAAPTGPGFNAPVGGEGLRGAASGMTLGNPVMNTNAPADNAGLPRGFVPAGGEAGPAGWAPGFAPSAYADPARSPGGSRETLTDTAVRFLSMLADAGREDGSSLLGGPAPTTDDLANSGDLLINRSVDDLRTDYPDERLAATTTREIWVPYRFPNQSSLEAFLSSFGEDLIWPGYPPLGPGARSISLDLSGLRWWVTEDGYYAAIRVGYETVQTPDSPPLAPPPPPAQRPQAPPPPPFVQTLVDLYAGVPDPSTREWYSVPDASGQIVSEAGSIDNIIRIEQGPPAPPGSGAGTGHSSVGDSSGSIGGLPVDRSAPQPGQLNPISDSGTGHSSVGDSSGSTDGLPRSEPQPDPFWDAFLFTFLHDYASGVVSNYVEFNATIMTGGFYQAQKQLSRLGSAVYKGGLSGGLSEYLHGLPVVGKVMDLREIYKEGAPFGWDYASPEDKGELLGHAVIPAVGLVGETLLLAGVLEGSTGATREPGVGGAPWETLGAHPDPEVIAQHSEMWCGQAAMETLFNWMGFKNLSQELATLMLIEDSAIAKFGQGVAEGTNVWQLKYVAEQADPSGGKWETIVAKADVIDRANQLNDVLGGGPVIVELANLPDAPADGPTHWVIVEPATDPGYVQVSDPAPADPTGEIGQGYRMSVPEFLNRFLSAVRKK